MKVKKVLISFVICILIFGSTKIQAACANQSDIQWIVDTWEICPFDVSFMQKQKNHSFTDDDVSNFLASPNSLNNIWLTGWLQTPEKDSWDLQIDQIRVEQEAEGVFVNRIPYIENIEDVRPQGTSLWRRVSINIIVDTDIINMDSIVDVLFENIKPTLVINHADHVYTLSPGTTKISKRLLEKNYWEDFSAELYSIETVYSETSIDWRFFNSYKDKENLSCWLVSFWVGNSSYPMHIKTINNYVFNESRSIVLADGYTFGGGFEFVSPTDDNHFVIGLVFAGNQEKHQREWNVEDNAKVVDAIKRKLEQDGLACKVSFEPTMLGYGEEEVGGPYYASYYYQFK